MPSTAEGSFVPLRTCNPVHGHGQLILYDIMKSLMVDTDEHCNRCARTVVVVVGGHHEGVPLLLVRVKPVDTGHDVSQHQSQMTESQQSGVVFGGLNDALPQNRCFNWKYGGLNH